MNILYTLGKMSFQTKRLTSTIIKHPKSAWQDIQAGYEMAKIDHEEEEKMISEEVSKLGEFTDALLKKEQEDKPAQGEFDFGGNK